MVLSATPLQSNPITEALTIHELWWFSIANVNNDHKSTEIIRNVLFGRLVLQPLWVVLIQAFVDELMTSQCLSFLFIWICLCIFDRGTCVLIMFSLTPAGGPAQTPLPGPGWYPGSSRRRARAGVCSQLSAPLFPRRGEMAHLEGPLWHGSKRGLYLVY